MIKKNHTLLSIFLSVRHAGAACLPAEDVLFMSENLNARGYHYIEYKGEGCSGCASCYYTCPEPLALEIHIPLKKEDAE